MSKTHEPKPIGDLLKKALGDCWNENPTIRNWHTTGSLGLDLTFRAGRSPLGMPGGKWIELFGAESSGKTITLLRMAAAVQQSGGLAIIVVGEHGLNTELYGPAGVDPSPDRLYTPPAFSLESCLSALEAIVLEYHDAPYPILLGIDSISGLGSAEYSMDESEVKDTKPSAADARELHQWWRRGILYYMSGSQIYGVMIRHETESPRPIFQGGGGYHTTHGKSINFYSWLRLRLKRSDLSDPEGGKRVGSWINAKVIKNKVGPLHGEFAYPWYYDRGFDEAVEVICFLVEHGALKKSTNKAGGKTGYIEYGDTKYLVMQLRELYHTNVTVRDHLRNLMVEVYLKNRSK